MNINFLSPYLSIIGTLFAIVWMSLFWTPVTAQEASAASQPEPMAMKIIEQIERPTLLSQNSCDEYIVNGGFEEDGAWSFEGSAFYDNFYESDGERSGAITTRGIYPGASSSARQIVRIPESYESIAIQFDTLLSESSPGNDLYVAIYDESRQNQLNLIDLSYDTPYEWGQWYYTPSIDLRGQTIYLSFSVVHNDDYYHTTAYFDNVSMTICESPVLTDTPSPTATPTPTPTNTLTNTPTPTPTPMNTLTNTPSPTATPTNTLTDTPEPTATPTNTLINTTEPMTSTPTRTSPSTVTSTATASHSPTYTPTSVPSRTPDILNLRVGTLEINQGIQTSITNVPLIANRPAMARVFIDVQNSIDSVSGVTAHLHGVRNGEKLPGSPLMPFNLGQSINAPSRFNQRNFNHSLNFRLPLDWTQAGQTQFWVEVNPESIVEEDSYADNTSRIFAVEFKKIPPLEIVLIPIVYQQNGIGPEYRPDMNADNNWGLGMLHRTYPVSDVEIERHLEYLFQGDMTTQAGWNQLLKELLDLRTREQPNSSASAASMPKYYGILPRQARLEGSKFNAGLAYKSGTAAIGLVDSESAAAHQLGHNLSLLHVGGCGSPAEIDERYPHANGNIGHIGVDIIKNNLIADTDYYDLMSYCSPKWISEYNYQKIFNLITDIETTTILISHDSWLISGRIYPDQTAKLETIEPIKSAAAVQGTGTGEYKLELIDKNKTPQFRYHFEPIEIVEEEHSKEPMDFSLVVRQIDNLKHIQISRGEEILDEMAAAIAMPTLNITHPPELILSNDINLIWETGLIGRSAATDQPTVNIRYSPDSGDNWQTIATGLSVNEFKLKRDQLPASDNGLIEVIAVDRNQVTIRQIEIGFVSDKAPEVGIIHDKQQEYYVGEPIFLEGRAIDIEDGTVPNDRLRWFVDGREEPSGKGQTLLLTETLAPGTHTIVLIAADSDGNTRSDSVSLTVYLDGQRIYLPFISQ